ncbi:MAG TPA: M15 family metallopeptidase [Candidatus Polarisedimenticolia bacterium]|nr:M15 family metallopeptidase [Candidatus Polarisedimenticolia bacterium]
MLTGDSYEERVARCLEELRIPSGYAAERHLPLHREATRLVPAGVDIYGRDRQLTPEAASAWSELQETAQRDGITLLLVSAFRGLDYQRQIFERKMAAGVPLEEMLKVNAPPGYSEHHTGRAVDLTTPLCAPLTEEFEATAAFAWLARKAIGFGFSMSYPRDNPFGIAYEPWHWALREPAEG